jgi:hypothetical protein
MTDHRRALLSAALAFLQLRDQPREVTLLKRWLDSWAGMGDVIAGLKRQGLDVELRQFALHRDRVLVGVHAMAGGAAGGVGSADPLHVAFSSSVVGRAGELELTQLGPIVD